MKKTVPQGVALPIAREDAEKRVLSLLTEVLQMDIVTLFRECKLDPVMFREALLSLLEHGRIRGGRGCMGKFWKLSKKEWAKECHFFYTYAHPEALASLREYFDRERGWPKHGEPVWVYETKLHHGKAVKTRGFEEAWLRLLKHARLIPAERSHDPGARYGYGVHNTRDLAISELCTVPGFNVMCADFWAGHEIDPLKYKEFYKTKPAYVDEQYRLAVPHLAILSGAVEQQARDQEALKKVEETIQRLSESVARLEQNTAQPPLLANMGGR